MLKSKAEVQVLTLLDPRTELFLLTFFSLDHHQHLLRPSDGAAWQRLYALLFPLYCKILSIPWGSISIQLLLTCFWVCIHLVNSNLLSYFLLDACTSLYFARLDFTVHISNVHGSILPRILEASAFGFWNRCGFLRVALSFCPFHSMQEDEASTPPFPAPHSRLLSFGPCTNDKGSTRGRAFHSKMLWCSAWAGVREGGRSPSLETERLRQEPLLFSKVESLRDEADQEQR